MKATIVIPVKNDLEALQLHLQSLASQNQALIDKVVIVENGSRQIHDLGVYPFTLEILSEEQSNRSRARNLGAGKGRTPYIAFFDADVVLKSNWLEATLRSFDAETLAVQTQIIPAGAEDNLLQQIRFVRGYQKGGQTFYSLKKSSPDKVILNSAAFVIRREVFVQIGGFDELLLRHEDWDLTRRLLNLPGKIKGIGSSSCEVFYRGSLLSYFIREMSCGQKMVRFHEKWTSRSGLLAAVALGSHGLRWVRSFWAVNWRPIPLSFRALEFCYLLGTAVGLLQIYIAPYSGRSRVIDVKAKVIFE